MVVDGSLGGRAPLWSVWTESVGDAFGSLI